MCVAAPMRLVGIDGDEGAAELGGVRRRVSLALLDAPKIGDYVLVHAGFAIAVVDEADAALAIEAMEACADYPEERGVRGSAPGEGRRE